MPQPLFMVATDLSARCDRATDRAFLLARQRHGSVLLVHILAAGDVRKEEEARAFIRDELGDRSGQAEIVIGTGPVPETLARIAEERQAKVILTGVGRFNELRDYVLGTAVDYLVRRAPVPVLVVKQRAREPYERIVVATDFSAGSDAAAETAAELFPAARLHAVHAYHAAYEGWLDKDATEDFIAGEARRQMEEMLRRLAPGVRDRLETSVEAGGIAEVLGRAMRRWRGDLLVLGSHGRGGFAHATIGSRAAELLASEPVDMLVVRPAR